MYTCTYSHSSGLIARSRGREKFEFGKELTANIEMRILLRIRRFWIRSLSVKVGKGHLDKRGDQSPRICRACGVACFTWFLVCALLRKMLERSSLEGSLAFA